MNNNLWAPKIYTPAGFLKEDIFGDKKALDLGCGQRKLPGAVGLDLNPDSQADIVHDIEKFPWPFPDNDFDLILANHVLEHVDDVLKILREIYRIAKPSAHIIVQVPYFRSAISFTDPTHRHFFTSHSFDYFIDGTKLADYKYVPFRFKKLGFWYGWPQKSKSPIKRLIKNFIHKHPDFYDQYLSLIFPTLCLTWEFEVLKKDRK